MKNPKLLLNAMATSALLGIGAASAADMPVKAFPIATPTASWTGCYIGGNAGWIGGDNRYSLAPSGSYLNPPGQAAPPNVAGTGAFLIDVAALSHTYNSHPSGGLIGGQVGCNQQNGRFVFGVEADWQWIGQRTTVDAAYAAFPSLGNRGFTNAAHTEHVSSRLDSFATFRGRAGFDFNGVFLYGTGGLAVADVHSDTNVTFAAVPFRGNPVFNGAVHIGSDSQIRVGWVVGAGAEYAFAPNWSVKAEYLYVDLGTQSFRSPLVAAVPPAAVGPGYNWNSSVRERDNIVRVGLNYKLDWATPVVAKY
ncbi:outer membrane protein [Bradyrhizobium sp.]|uniref:outer membrane protein n=1 Tax=Bradyrhizobium sp. TaxID=376 RepID=UPI003C7837E8